MQFQQLNRYLAAAVAETLRAVLKRAVYPQIGLFSALEHGCGHGVGVVAKTWLNLIGIRIEIVTDGMEVE